MDPTLTRSEAHRLFGELYRKARSPEMQQKVDQIVAETSDIFLRLEKIEALEKGTKSTGVEVRSDRQPGGRARSDTNENGASRAPAGSRPKKGRKKSIIKQILGGDVVTWGEETGTLDVSFFGLSHKISKRVSRLYNLKEEQVISVIKCLRFAIANGWQVWNPEKYNTVMVAYQFFNEFVKVPQFFKMQLEPDIWLTNTLKMQKLYGMLLAYPNYRKTLLEDLPAFMEGKQKVASHIPHLRAVMNYLMGLESKTPSLKNSILVHYAMVKKHLETWENVMAELNVPPAEVSKYRAPDTIQKKIHEQTKKLKEDRAEKLQQIRNMEEMKASYFTFDSNGKVKVDFINEIITDIIPKIYPQNLVNENLFHSVKTEPHKLLFALMRDFELNLLQVISGSITIKTNAASGPEEVLIFKQGLMNKHLDNTAQVSREIETFVKKHSEFDYTFKDFLADTKSKPDDTSISALLQIIRKANALFYDVIEDLEIVIENHHMAQKADQQGAESIIRTKSIQIENIQIGRRFIPHAEEQIANTSRLQGKSIQSALEEIVRNFYNYLYIFRDGKLAKEMVSVPKIKEEIAEIEKLLNNLGISFS